MLSLGSRVGRADDGLQTDADGRLALGVLDGLLATQVVALVVVHVVHVRHRPRTLTVVVIGEIEGLVLVIAVLDDVV